MSTHREVLTLNRPLAHVLATCQSAANGPGWTVAAQASDRLTCREVPPPMSWGSPVTVEITLAVAGEESTQLTLHGSNFGLGPIQSNHVAKRVRALRQQIEAALQQPAPSQIFTRSVVVNNVRVSDEQLAQVERQHGLRINDGDFWYDKVCGAWGARGGPTLGFLPAGLPLGGPLAREASGGNTGVIINGRELHPHDVAGLSRLVPMVLPGRYWVDASGNFGWEGGLPLGNLWLLHRQVASGGAGSTRSNGMTVGGDGQGFVYASGKDALGNYFQVTSG
jgi:hypothetical protein